MFPWTRTFRSVNPPQPLPAGPHSPSSTYGENDWRSGLMPQSTAPPPSPESLTASQFARRERIVRVALKLLVNGDYEKIQMKDVAEGSDVALGTVYRYFTSKEHLFAAVQLEWVKSLHRQILKHPPAGNSNLGRLSQVLHEGPLRQGALRGDGAGD
jgi:hypothetical protein